MDLPGSDADKQLSPTARERVENAVFRAVDLLNETLAPTQQLEKKPGTLVVDTGGNLDSMAVVNLIVFIEDEIAQNLGRQLDLTGGDPFESEDLATLGSMIDALGRKLSH